MNLQDIAQIAGDSYDPDDDFTHRPGTNLNVGRRGGKKKSKKKSKQQKQKELAEFEAQNIARNANNSTKNKKTRNLAALGVRRMPLVHLDFPSAPSNETEQPEGGGTGDDQAAGDGENKAEEPTSVENIQNAPEDDEAEGDNQTEEGLSTSADIPSPSNDSPEDPQVPEQLEQAPPPVPEAIGEPDMLDFEQPIEEDDGTLPPPPSLLSEVERLSQLAEGLDDQQQQQQVLFQINPSEWEGQIGKGNARKKAQKSGAGIPEMRVPVRFFANRAILNQMQDEIKNAGSGTRITKSGSAAVGADNSGGGYVSALQQLVNVSTLPGIVGASIGMPDLHCGYGFAIGNVAAFDMGDPEAVVSPGGVGFDINCGVRLLRTNLTERQITKKRDRIAQILFQHVPVGVGASSNLRLNTRDMESILNNGMGWALEKGYCWEGDLETCEEGGCFPGASASDVSINAKRRGIRQVGTLGSGNHYLEVQVVDEIFDAEAAARMDILEVGQVVVMIHSGSRGLGHQVCTDAVREMEAAVKRQKINCIDRQLSCCRIQSDEGQKYLRCMKAAGNFGFVNRTLIAKAVRESFEEIFQRTAEEMEMHQVYDVSHNIAKEETHAPAGQEPRQLLVHRKGATRAFPPGHPDLPERYRDIGQPVLIGGSMGTASYVLLGTEEGMDRSFGSTCHGAGRVMSRSQALRELDSRTVINQCDEQGVSVRVATRDLAAEEAPDCYKCINDVVDTCHSSGISKRCVKLRPIACVKG